MTTSGTEQLSGLEIFRAISTLDESDENFAAIREGCKRVDAQGLGERFGERYTQTKRSFFEVKGDKQMTKTRRVRTIITGSILESHGANVTEEQCAKKFVAGDFFQERDQIEIGTMTKDGGDPQPFQRAITPSGRVIDVMNNESVHITLGKEGSEHFAQNCLDGLVEAGWPKQCINVFYTNDTNVNLAVHEMDVFMNLAELSPDKLHRHPVGREVCLTGVWAHLRCHAPNKSSAWVMTSSDSKIEESEEKKGPGHYKEMLWQVRPDNGWAVVVGEWADEDGRITPEIQEIHLWGDTDPAPAIKKICEWLYGKDATPTMLEAKKNGFLKEWAIRQVSAGSAPWMVQVGSEELPLCYSEAMGGVSIESPRGNNAVAGIICHMRYADLLKSEVLYPEQRDYAQAVMDKEAGIKYLASTSKFFRNGEKLYHLIEDQRLVKVRKDQYVEYGPLAILNRHNLYNDVLVSAPELGGPLPVKRPKEWSGQVETEGVKIEWSSDVLIEGPGEYVWTDLGMKNLRVWQIS